MNGTNMGSDPLNMKMLKPLDEVFRCPICSDFFNNCVMTSCSHDFCAACIKKRLATESDCPTCYEDIHERDLRNNDSMDKLVRIYKKLTSLDMLFCVVEFLEGNQSPSVVPSAWLENDNEVLWCWFPTKDARKHVLKRSSPEDGWDLFKVNVLRFSRDRKDSDDYLKHQKDSSIKILKYSSTDKKTKTSLPEDSKLHTVITTPGTLQAEALTHSNVLQAQGTPSSKLPQAQLLACSSCGTSSDLIALSSKVDRVMRKLDDMSEQINVITQTFTVVPNLIDVQVDKIEAVCLPLESKYDLDNLESRLEDGEEFEKYVRYLGRFGGRDVTHVTRKILLALIKNSFGVELNWIGTYGKIGLKFYPRVCQLISAAVRQTSVTAEAKQSDVEEVMKKWLRCALDRNGGRSKKRRTTSDC